MSLKLESSSCSSCLQLIPQSSIEWLQFYEEGFPTAKRLLGVHQASKAAAALALSGDIDIRVTPLLLAAYTVYS